MKRLKEESTVKQPRQPFPRAPDTKKNSKKEKEVKNNWNIQFTSNQTESRKKKKPKKMHSHGPLVMLAGFPVSVAHSELIVIREERRNHWIGGAINGPVHSIRCCFCFHFFLSANS